MEELNENIELAIKRLKNLDETLEDIIEDVNDVKKDLINFKSKSSPNTIKDLNLFKDKLELYGLRSEELWNFIDDYMRLYNK